MADERLVGRLKKNDNEGEALNPLPKLSFLRLFRRVEARVCARNFSRVGGKTFIHISLRDVRRTTCCTQRSSNAMREEPPPPPRDIRRKRIRVIHSDNSISFHPPPPPTRSEIRRVSSPLKI